MKIYNEIVIDMNPESSTFEETIHEDSFEYSGDMMLMQGGDPTIQDGTQMVMQVPNPEAFHYHTGVYGEGAGSEVYDYDIDYDFWDAVAFDEVSEGGLVYEIFEWQNGEWVGTGVRARTVNSQSNTGEMGLFDDLPIYGDSNEATIAMSETPWGESLIGETEEYGMESLTYEDVQGMTPTELRKYIEENVYGGDLDAYNLTENELSTILLERLPQLGELPSEELDTLATQFGIPDDPDTEEDESIGGSFAQSLAGEAADIKRQKNTYELQAAAAHLGQPGVSMRKMIEGRGAIGRSFETSQDAYDLAQRGAALDYGTGVYGLEQEAIAQWESDWAEMLGGLPGMDIG